MRSHLRLSLLICSLLVFGLVFVPSLGAQTDYRTALLQGLPFRSIGPAIMGGRIDDFAVAEGNPSLVYAATASGGLWKTENHGTSWTTVFDTQVTSSIGAVALAPSDSNVVWVGTGEANGRQSSSWGHGVYRSTDAGKTWTHCGLESTLAIGRIVVHPTDPNTAFVAAAGSLWGASQDRGVYKTTDGGKTWMQSLFVDADTGAIDLVIDPAIPSTLYASSYQRRRTPFSYRGLGAGSGIHKTMDGGRTWVRLNEGLPKGPLGRIGLCLYKKNPAILYAIVEHDEGGIFRTENGGASWTKTAGMGANNRPSYYSQIRVDPSNDQVVWTGGLALSISVDGAKSFRATFAPVHSDFHAIWIDPANSKHVLSGSDGGIQWSWDQGRTWDFVSTLPLAQFYEVGYDMRTPYWVYGGLQDNGTWGAPSRTLNTQGVTNDDWQKINGGDGFFVRPDPTDWRVTYAESQNGSLARINVELGESKSIRPRSDDGETYRFDWNSPLLISPHNPRRLLYGGNRLFISEDRGDTWRRTEDLTTKPDMTKLPIFGSVPTRAELARTEVTPSTYGQIVTLTESPLKAGVLYAGTDDGNLQVSKDDGKTFVNVADRVPGLPKGTYVSRLEASHHAPGRCYAAFDGHRANDFAPYLYVTEDYGQTWARISAGLDQGSTLSVVREHFRQPNLLFAGAERGLYISLNRGASWTRVAGGLPTVPIDDIAIHPRENDLILGTHGRGIYLLDDLGALEALAGETSEPAAMIFAPSRGRQYRLTDPKGFLSSRWFAGENPPSGLVLQYYLKEKPTEASPVKIDILEKDGKTLVRELRPGAGGSGGGGFGGRGGGAPPRPSAPQVGLNRTVWDMRAQAPPQGFRGQRVRPGEYVARLSVGPIVQSVPLKVENDPRLNWTSAQEKDYFGALASLSRYSIFLAQARKAVTDVKTQLVAAEAVEAMKSAPSETKAKVAEFKQMLAKVDALFGVEATPRPGGRGPGRGAGAPGGAPPVSPTPEAQRSQVPPRPAPFARIATVLGDLDRWSEPPSRELRREIERLGSELRSAIGKVNGLLGAPVAELNAALLGAGLEKIAGAATIDTRALR